MKTEIKTTNDGSHTLFVPELNEHYHSTHGAIQEAIHVYINAGLHHCKKDEIHVLEIGFGTGLNAFLTLCESIKNNKKIVYTSLELYPISVADAQKLNYASQICPENENLFLQLHEIEWEKKIDITPHFSLLKLNRNITDSTALAFSTKFDVIYFDAFAPDKQPEMWTHEIFKSILSICNSNAALTTYCAKGAVRRTMQKAGFMVERLTGPAGKREMLRAISRFQISDSKI